MSIDELCALPVGKLAKKDCLLFLWATFPQLPEALQLIKAWGFQFKTVAFVWLKRNKKSPTWFYGLGYWTRGNAEICLLAKRGKPKRHSAGVHQFIISPVEEHSKTLDAAALAELNAVLQNPRGGFENIGQIIDYADNVDYFVHIPDVQTTTSGGTNFTATSRKARKALRYLPRPPTR